MLIHPKMDRRLARSPVLKSPVLSPKSPAIYEKYKSGCAWGLIHFFNFRQAHSHGKLISDRKRANRPAKGDGYTYTMNKPNFPFNEEKALYIEDAVDNKNVAVNSRKPEVKNVIEEEMSLKHQTKKKRANGELLNQPFNPKLVGHSKDHRKAIKSSKKSCRFPACGCDTATEGYRQPSDKKLVEKSSNINLASVTEASYNDVNTTNGGNHSCKNVGGRPHGHQREINVQVKMNEAVEAFVNQKSTDGENPSRNEVANRSNNFIDTLEVLNSIKELFMKLIQDPNSLLVKHIQDLPDSQVKKQQPQSSSKTKTSQCQPEGGEECDRCLSKGSDMPWPSNTTVVLKSGIQNCPDKISNWPSLQSCYSLRKKEKSVRPAFLSFEHMKRKLRHAMRVNKKEHCQMSLDDIHKSLHDFEQFEDGDKEMSRQANERVSASKSYQDDGNMSESFHEVNRRDGLGQTDNNVTGIGSKATSSTESCHRTSNLSTLRYLNGKYHPSKYLSYMLNRGNEDFSGKPTLRTLDRLTSLLEYDLLPRLTPQRDKGLEFASPQMGSGCLNSPINTLGAQLVSDNKKLDNQLEDAKKNISGDLSPSTKVLQTVYSLGDDFSHKVNQTSVCPGKVMEGNHVVRWDKCESNALDVTLEPNGLQNNNTTQRTGAVNLVRESEYFECSKLNSPSGDQTSSSSIDVYSSSPLCIQRAEISDSTSDKAEQPSPVSVLELSFVEDSANFSSTVSLAAEPPVEPFCIDIEELYATSLLDSQWDPKYNAGTSEDSQGSLTECIRAVLQISGLNWNELSRKWHLSDQIRDTSLFDNVEVRPEKSGTYRRLLFGYISEVLLEIYQCYFRCSPWISLLNPQPRRAMLSKNAVQEVLRHVDWLLLSELPQQTLQQLVEKDLRKSGTWIDVQLDTEEVVTELVDCILEDLEVDAAIRLQT